MNIEPNEKYELAQMEIIECNADAVIICSGNETGIIIDPDD